MEDHSYSIKIIESTPSTSTLMISQQTPGSCSDQGPTSFKCDMCEKSFQYKSGVYKHRVKVHSAVYEGRIKCFETGCSLSFRTSNRLKTHLTAKHHIKFTSEIKLFPNMKEFLVWKEDIEENNDVRYVLLNGNSQYPDKKVRHFKCHRSGTYVPRVAADGRQRRLKSQGSDKMGQMCTSEVMVTEYTKDGHVKASYCATHYGHKMGLQPQFKRFSRKSHLFLSKTEKKSISAQLLQGVSKSKILDNINDNLGKHIHLVCVKERGDIPTLPESTTLEDHSKPHKVVEILDLVKKPQEELESRIKSLKTLYLSLLPKIASCTDINILDVVTAQMQKINNMLSMGSSSQEHSHKEPPNKLMTKQTVTVYIHQTQAKAKSDVV